MLTPRASVLVLSLVVTSIAVSAQAPATRQAGAADAACARTWVEGSAKFEDFIRSASVTSIRDVPVGVTRPRRAFLTPGGLVESVTWKQIPPGFKSGYYESYKSEIAAYELDKHLALHMVPPTVERNLEGKTGAAVMWASPTRSFKELGGVPGQKGVAAPPGAAIAAWTRQVVRAKMFDNLIANTDPNLGNWLVDDDWHLILIDHTRAFTTMKSMVHQMDNIDRELWDRIAALDEASLQKPLGQWLGKGEIRALLDRRDRMNQEIKKLVAKRGDAVFLP